MTALHLRLIFALMAGERASTVWQKQTDRMCANCSAYLGTPERSEQRLCNTCIPRFRVLMNFMSRDGMWHISFLQHDCKTPLARKLTFGDADKIREMNKRFGSRIAEDICSLDYGITHGRGSIWLMLEREQYDVLLRPRPRHAPRR